MSSRAPAQPVNSDMSAYASNYNWALTSAFLPPTFTHNAILNLFSLLRSFVETELRLWPTSCLSAGPLCSASWHDRDDPVSVCVLYQCVCVCVSQCVRPGPADSRPVSHASVSDMSLKVCITLLPWHLLRSSSFIRSPNTLTLITHVIIKKKTHAHTHTQKQTHTQAQPHTTHSHTDWL